MIDVKPDLKKKEEEEQQLGRAESAEESEYGLWFLNQLIQVLSV